MVMGKKLSRKALDVERMLEAVLEVSAWQADLVRAALRQVRAESKTKRGGTNRTTGRGDRRKDGK